MEIYEIVAGSGGIKAPETVPAGVVTFRIQATDPDDAWLGVVKLADGIPLEKHVDNLRTAYGYGPDAMAASKVVDREFTMLGGGAVTGRTSVSFTAELTEGTYHLFDYKRVKDDGFTAASIPVVRAEAGSGQAAAALPEASVEIVQCRTDDGPRFRAPDRIPSGASIRITNDVGQYNEAILMAVKEGATSEDVAAFFTAKSQGLKPPMTDLIRANPVGCVPLSHGRSAVIAADLTPGPYVLTTWLTNLTTARMFAVEGMHQMITVD
ncbi:MULTISPECIES: hypothetical protein [unclassified Streptomyces]|uniref:hypothetical protein n=1 Tax=unclassified Streptomyces TaxID=2593676 RepID=UPI0011CD2CC8|nr:hypothetical protein [Streptomyces sp.]